MNAIAKGNYEHCLFRLDYIRETFLNYQVGVCGTPV